MKSNHSSRYADLLTKPTDEALSKLVQELDSAYTAPTRPAELSWENAQRVSRSTSNVEFPLPPVQLLPIHITRHRKRVLLAVAAIVAVAVLGAGLFNMAYNFRFQRDQQAVTAIAPLAMIGQLVQDKGTPTNIQQLLQNGQFASLNLSSHTFDVDVQKAYIDANNVVLLYSVDMSAWNAATTCSLQEATSNTCIPEPVLTLKTSTGQMLTETAERANMGKEPVYKNKLVAILAYYDASTIQGNPAQLTLTVALSKNISPSQEKIGAFTIHVHTEKIVLNVHQTALSNGHVLTLERVVITPTEARFYYSYKGSLASSADSITSFADETISIAGQTYSPNPFPVENGVDVYGWFNPGAVHENYTSFHLTLLGQKGTWVFTERAVVDENLNGPPSAGKNIHYAWTFTLTVS